MRSIWKCNRSSTMRLENALCRCNNHSVGCMEEEQKASSLYIIRVCVVWKLDVRRRKNHVTRRMTNRESRLQFPMQLQDVLGFEQNGEMSTFDGPNIFFNDCLVAFHSNTRSKSSIYIIRIHFRQPTSHILTV
jgi:hypothetical protein